MKIRKNIWVCIIGIIIVWGILFGVDYYRVVQLCEKPIFTFYKVTQDDGGSGTYYGLGYTFNIKGHFMILDERPGVTSYELYLLGYNVK